MAEIVGAYGTSHTAMMIRKYDPQKADQVRVHNIFSLLKKEIEELQPDAIVIIASEHMKTFFYDNYPQYCIGVGEMAEGWGEAGVPAHQVGICRDLANYILHQGVERGFDFSWSVNMKLDHGFMSPLHLITPEMKFPIVPIFQNASTPPLPTFDRAASLGESLGEIIRDWPVSRRVVLIGTGGISHWVGTPEMGRINVDFDKEVLSWFSRGELHRLRSLASDEVGRSAGNGAQEIRNWVTVMAAVPNAKAEILVYEPVQEWATGIGIVRFVGRGVQ